MARTQSVEVWPRGLPRQRAILRGQSVCLRILDLYGRMVAAGEWRD
jgi:hypothetical protein